MIDEYFVCFHVGYHVFYFIYFLFLFSCYLYLYSVDSVYVVLLASSICSILHFCGFMERLNKLKFKLKLMSEVTSSHHQIQCMWHFFYVNWCTSVISFTNFFLLKTVHH
jgi:hypothetical protein